MSLRLSAVAKVFLFVTLLQFSRANNCNQTTYQKIENVTTSCGDDIFVMADEECTVENDVESNRPISINCTADRICFVQRPNDTSCRACVEGSYGFDCTEDAVCATSHCSYSRTDGCTPDAGTQKECNLLKLDISGPLESSGTIGITDEIIINITVNLNEDDVNVTVSKPRENVSSEMEMTDENLYVYRFVVGEDQPGEYTFNATAFLNGNSTDIVDNTVVRVDIYDPVKITSVKAKLNTSEDNIAIVENIVSLDKSEAITDLICSAEGLGVSPVQVSWLENGGRISDVSTGNNKYQTESIDGKTTILTLIFPPGENYGVYTCEAFSNDNVYNFFDVRTIEVTQTINTPQATYADETEFIIAVCILGVALIITIIAFTIAFIYKQKMHKNELKTLQSRPTRTVSGPTAPKGEDNKSFDRLEPKDNKSLHTTPQINGRRPDKDVRRSYYPTVGGPTSTPHVQRNVESGSSENSYIPLHQTTMQAKEAAMKGRVLAPEHVKPQQIPALYDEVAVSVPQLPERNRPTSGNDEDMYLQPDAIYEETPN